MRVIRLLFDFSREVYFASWRFVTIFALFMVALFAMSASAQTPDSVRKYSSTHVDSTKTWFTRVAVRVDTVRKTDTLWRTPPVVLPDSSPTFPPLPIVKKGIAFGPWNYPLDSLGKWSYNATVLPASPTGILDDLAKVRAKGAHVALSLLRAKTKDASGKLSVSATKAYLSSLPDIAGYITDGTVVAINVSDDVNASTWGGEDPPRDRLDSLAKLVTDRWPNAITTVRNRPDQSRLPGGRKYRWLSAAWAQYNSPFRDGPPEKYLATQKAVADSLGLGLVVWFNTLSGGCGPADIQSRVAADRRCLADAPGTGIYATYADTTVRRYQMSAPEVLKYGRIFLPVTCLALHWTWSYGYGGTLASAQLRAVQGFDGRADVKAAMAALRAMADTLPAKECKK